MPEIIHYGNLLVMTVQEENQDTALIQDDAELLEPLRYSSLPVQVEWVKDLQSSPYTEEDHLLDLETVGIEYRLLAIALQSFEPTDKAKFAFNDYTDAFNFAEVVSLLRKISLESGIDLPEFKSWVIVFRSALQPEVRLSGEKRKALATLDRLAHVEANKSGGLLKYWFGFPDPIEGRNLATCFWTCKDHAKNGGSGRSHKKATVTSKGWFKLWKIEEYELSISQGAKTFSLVRLV